MIKELLLEIISKPFLHGRWLNTLSYFENCGARLIAKSENPSMVPKEILKHAAEEFRHAYFFKSQITKVTDEKLNTYTLPELLGGYCTKHYFERLNNNISRYLKKEKNVSCSRLKELAYLFVTYAVEIRAESIYPIYQMLLEGCACISLKNIIRDEKHHLDEIYEQLTKIFEFAWIQNILEIEKRQYDIWEHALLAELNKPSHAFFERGEIKLKIR